MNKKIFVSYKHSDEDVENLSTTKHSSTVRDYVEEIEKKLEGIHIYKGERDNEDLSNFKEDTIKSHLREKIYDSSITIVLISKNMKETNKPEEDQWIPWEISYSLKEVSRDERKSLTNGMIAVALPDKNGSYDYIFTKQNCKNCNLIIWKIRELFSILKKNTFNIKNPKKEICKYCKEDWITGEHSYIKLINWKDFFSDFRYYLSKAIEINKNIENYNITKEI